MPFKANWASSRVLISSLGTEVAGERFSQSAEQELKVMQAPEKKDISKYLSFI